MNKSLVAIALVVVALGGVGTAIAQSSDRVVEIWTCTVNDGKTIEDVRNANSKWVEHQNATVEGGDIHSYVLTSVVGMNGHRERARRGCGLRVEYAPHVEQELIEGSRGRPSLATARTAILPLRPSRPGW